MSNKPSISPSDLRGGNYVQWGSVQVKFTGTTYYGKGQFGIEGGDLMPLVNYGGHEYYQVAWENLSPIELTPSILEKCGFEVRDGYSYAPEINNWRMKIYPVEGGYMWAISNWNVIVVKHLHHLQNLYFALTQTELTINL